MMELKNSKTTFLGRANGRDCFALDASIGALQMRGEGEEWQDIKPTIVQTAQGWRVDGAPYAVDFSADGGRKIFPDRQDRSKYLNLPAMPFFKNLTRRIEGNCIIASAPKYDVMFILTNSGIHFQVLIKEPVAFDRITLDMDSAGLDILQLLKATQGLGIPRPRLIEQIDSPDAKERWLDWSLKAGQLELGFDLTGLKFPVLLKNTTLDLSVAAGFDDDYVRRSDTSWANGTAVVRIGNFDGTNKQYGGSMRFTGINIPSGATVGTSYLLGYATYSRAGTTANSDLCCENTSNPGQMASYADHIGRTRTASVPWDSIPAWTAGTTYQSPSITTPIQTVVTTNGGTGDALIVFWEDKDNESSSGAVRDLSAWEDTSYPTVAIHIEYTTAAAFIPKIVGII